MNSQKPREQTKKQRSWISRFLRRVLSITIYVIVFFLLFILLLHIQPVQNFAGKWFIHAAGKLLQKQINCESFQISLLGKVELHNVSIIHHERFGDDPLASVKKLAITFSPLSLLSDQFHIKHVMIDTPVFNFIFASDRNHNLQKNPFDKSLSASDKSPSDSIHAFFKHFQPENIQIINGSFLLDYAPSEYRLFVPSVSVKGEFNKKNNCIYLCAKGFCIENTYPERLSVISNIHLQADISEKGIQHSLVTISSISGQTWVTGKCTLDNFENPELVFDGILSTNLNDIKELTLLNTVLEGDSSLFFSGHGPAVNLDISGKLFSNDLQFGQFKFASFDASASYHDSQITLADAQGNAYDGSLRGTAKINFDKNEKSLDVEAWGDNLNIAVLTRDLEIPFQMETSASITLDLFVDNFNPDALVVAGTLNGVEKKPNAISPEPPWIPLDLLAQFTFIDGMFEISEGRLTHPDHQIILDSCIFSPDTLEGSIWGSTQNLADFLQRGNRSVPLQMDIPGLTGRTDFTVELGGTTSDYQVETHLNAENIQFHSEQIGTIEASVLINSKSIDIDDFTINGSDLVASGQIVLGMPVAEQTESVSLNNATIDISLFNLKMLDSILLDRPMISGTASGIIRICDSENNDFCFSHVHVDELTLLDVLVKPVDFNGKLTPSGIFDASVTAASENTYLAANFDYPFSGIPVISMSAQNVSFGVLSGLDFLGLSGDLDLTAQSETHSDDIKIHYQITSSNPAMMNYATSKFEANGYYQHTAPSHLVWNANWNNDMAKSTGLCSLVFPYACSLETQIRSFPLSVVSDIINKDNDAPNPFKGSISLDATLSGNLGEIHSLNSDIQLSKMEFDYLDLVLVLDEQGKLQFTNGSLTFEPLVFKHPSINMTLDGSIESNGDLSFQTIGNINLSALDSLTDFFKDSRGNCNFDLALKGPWFDPGYFGSVRVHELFSYLPLFGSNLEDYHAEVRFNQKLGKIMYIEGLTGGSYFGGSGEFGISSYVPDLFDIKFSGEDIEFEYPKDFHSNGDISLEISGHLPEITIGGKVNLRQSQYGARINYKTMIVNESRAKLTFSERRKPIRLLDDTPSIFNPNFNISVRANDNIHINNNIARVEMNMKLDVLGNLERPKVLGHIDVLRGEVTFLQRNFELNSASIDFADPTKIDPLLVLQASTTLDDYRVNLDISGNVYSDINIRPSSTPPLNDIDLWNLLLIGKTREKMSSSEDYLASGVAYVTGSLQEQIEQRFEYWMGLDEFSIDPVMSTSDESPSARFTAKKRFGPDLSVLYSRSATSTEDLLLIEYQLSDNIYIVGHKKEDNSLGVDFRYRWEFE